MAAKSYYLLAICLLTGAILSDAADDSSNGTTALPLDANITDSSTGNDTGYKNFGGDIHNNKVPELTKCDKAFCHLGKCTEVKGIGAVCSCPDDRMFLAVDGRTCKKKTCNDNKPARRFTCGKGAKCNMRHYDVDLRLNMPQCSCPDSRWGSSTKLVLDPSTNSCIRDPRYQTCDWPKPSGCDQGCKTAYNARGKGSYPQCTCRTGYTFDTSKNKCVVSDPCKADNSNGGCKHQCNFNKQTLVVRCSCHSTDYTLASDGKSCLTKNCKNANSGCQQNCIPLSSRDYYCSCNRGYHLNPDSKTCYDYDECAGHHGCDQQCVPDGKGYFTCDCNSGYSLAADGYSCRVDAKCINHGCSQHCNPTTGACYCDKTHTLAADGRMCVDVDECALRTHNCQEKCENTDGGFTCGCFDDRATLSNDLKTCILDTCEEISDIQNGKVQCTKSHSDSSMKVGDYCTFTCNRGTRLVGSNFVKCTKTGYNIVPPHCANINECEDPNRCLENERCYDTIGSFACPCKSGYQKQNGVCTDVSGPIIVSCPDDAILQLPDDASTVQYRWNKPVVRDPTDAKVTCFNCPSSEEKTFGVGSVAIRYWYSDDAGNKNLCSFKVKVVDATPPVIQNCPNGTVFEKGPGVYDISEFAKVTATDNSGQVTLTNDEPPKFTNPGLRTVNYVAKDNSGNHATCSFYVNITIKDCPELSPPENGFHGCDDWHIGSFCTPNCNKGFGFFNPPSNKYHCGDDGTWNPAGPLPKCYPVVQPEEATLKYVSKYSGECPKDKPAALEQIQAIAENYFNTSKQAFCFDDNSCGLVGEPSVECNGDTFTVSLITDENYSKVPDHNTMITEFKKKIKVEQDKNKGQPLMALFIPPLTILQPLLDQNGLPSTPMFTMSCPTGSKNIGNQCVTCPPGGSC